MHINSSLRELEFGWLGCMTAPPISIDRLYICTTWDSLDKTLGGYAETTTKQHCVCKMFHLTYKLFHKEKVYITPHLSYLVYFNPPTINSSVLPPELSKTVYFTSGRFSAAFCYSNSGLLQYQWFWIPFFYLFSVNFWKIIVNHRKIIKWKI